jgi:hypothetical protein
MEVIRSSDTSGLTRPAQRHIHENGIIPFHIYDMFATSVIISPNYTQNRVSTIVMQRLRLIIQPATYNADHSLYSILGSKTFRHIICNILNYM